MAMRFLVVEKVVGLGKLVRRKGIESAAVAARLAEMTRPTNGGVMTWMEDVPRVEAPELYVGDISINKVNDLLVELAAEIGWKL